MKRSNTSRLLIVSIDQEVTNRARKAVQHILSSGTDIHDVARLVGTTVHDLLDGSKKIMTRGELVALRTHYNISLLWLWTGVGPQYLKDLKTDGEILSKHQIISSRNPV